MDDTNFFPTLEQIDSVGSVTIKEDELVIGREEQLVYTYIKAGFRDVKVGEYIRIPYETIADGKERMMFGSIKNLRYRQKTPFNDQHDSDLSRDVGEHNYSYVAQIEPIAIVTDSNEQEGDDDESVIYTRKSVSMPPNPQSKVFVVEDKKFLQTGLDLPENGDFAGFLAVDGEKVPSEENPLAYYFENPQHGQEGEPQIFRHSLVCGSTGKGKTHFSKNLLRQYIDNKRFEENIPQVEREENNITDETEPRRLNISIIDPEDEYIDMREDGSDITTDKKAELRKELCEKHGIKYGGVKNDPDLEIEAWQPQVKKEYETKGRKTFSIPFRIVEKYPDLLISFSTNEPTQMAIYKLVDSYFEFIHSEPEREAKYSHFSNWADTEIDAQIDSDSIERAVRRRIINSSLYNSVFDQGGEPLDKCSSEMFKRGKVTVFPMRHLKGRMEQLVVMSLMRYIVDNQLATDAKDTYLAGTPLLLCVDEAHKYLSEPSNTQENAIINEFRETAKRGRKENFGLYIVTQNPQDIDEEIRKQINTKVFLGLDANIINSNDVHVPQEYKQRIIDFDKGEAVIQAPGKRPVEVMGLPFSVVAHKE